MRRLTRDVVVSRFIAVHMGKWDYSKVVYTGRHDKITIGCSIHGDFKQTPANHEKGQGCPICGDIMQGKSRRYSRETFIEKAVAVHGNAYTYEKVTCAELKNKEIITCPKHGDFLMHRDMHLYGQGCKHCWREAQAESQRYSTEEYVERANVVHENLFDYSEVVYTRSTDKITIICKEHGRFSQEAASHLTGIGCPKCSTRGFNNALPGYLYVLQCDNLVKVGITGREVSRRLAEVVKSSRKPFEVAYSRYFEDGTECRNKEGDTLAYLRNRYASPAQKYDGYSETFTNALVTDVVLACASDSITNRFAEEFAH